MNRTTRRTARAFLAAGLLGLNALSIGGMTVPSALAATGKVDWQQHDTVVYVVSTLNLLQQRNGHQAAQIFHRWGVTSYDVYGDPKVRDLYFIQLHRGAVKTVATFAYAMGWTVPRGLSVPRSGIRVRPAPYDVRQSSQNDPLRLLGSTTSLSPS